MDEFEDFDIEISDTDSVIVNENREKYFYEKLKESFKFSLFDDLDTLILKTQKELDEFVINDNNYFDYFILETKLDSMRDHYEFLIGTKHKTAIENIPFKEMSFDELVIELNKCYQDMIKAERYYDQEFYRTKLRYIKSYIFAFK